MTSKRRTFGQKHAAQKSEFTTTKKRRFNQSATGIYRPTGIYTGASAVRRHFNLDIQAQHMPVQINATHEDEEKRRQTQTSRCEYHSAYQGHRVSPNNSTYSRKTRLGGGHVGR